MQTTKKPDKLVIKDGWLMCPSCGKQRVLRIYPETRAKCLQVYCKRCGHEHIVNIDECLCHMIRAERSCRCRCFLHLRR